MKEVNQPNEGQWQQESYQQGPWRPGQIWVVAARKRMARLIWVNKHGAGAPRLSRIRAWKLSFLNHLEMTGRGSGSLEMVCRGSCGLEVAGRSGGSLEKS